MRTTKSHVIALLAELHHSGDHEAAWRLPTGRPELISDYGHYLSLAREAERGGFDALFFADFQAFREGFRDRMPWGFDPISLLAAIAADCPDIGIVATASTVFNRADSLARTFATLHQQTSGRVGWNIVTSGTPEAAASFGLSTNPPHDERYRQAEDFVLNVLDWWRKDPNNIGLSAENRPALVQAGASPVGRDFAARYAELVFTAVPDVRAAADFRADIRRRASRIGRSPNDVKVTPGFFVVVGSTEAEAKALREELDAKLTDNQLRRMLADFGIDIDRYGLDDEIQGHLRDLTGSHSGIQSRIEVFQRVASSMGSEVTLRKLARRVAGSRGHLSCTGTPEQIADTMERVLDAGGADGFVIKFSHNPGGITDFVDGVIPELQRRGLYRGGYESQSLRARFGSNPNIANTFQQRAATGAALTAEKHHV
ncbi:LLM class flavin-dependent oxidoreductase [Mycolicibacterium goodii]|jgi:alkanesulfonate monooxygenase SsuD/methylene tetrahydromethanopterin reductase-like flavin-dependent oxidoreductase (luciferase family)|uniref:LLM class flavin-dependent oxidoreductase n=1 Tax=Mycolicibacterium goodii TaxID=134601 RepID=UPI001BDC9CB6|nr:LLM class flavin-dependent oxidoreductase [Mycolicibacterium goodii]MBU8813273.1 LLM class flavin-dependent oxidoreductase [Mycolicibacterium goodii]